MFASKGVISVDAEQAKKTEDEMFELAIEAGAEDLKTVEETFEIYTEPGQLDTVRKYLEAQKIPLKSVTLSMIPQNTVEVTGDQANQVLKLVDALEENDDVQNVYANFDIPDAELEQM
jgi:transcriptional/translational regulatory protein YebC/TACO1